MINNSVYNILKKLIFLLSLYIIYMVKKINFFTIIIYNLYGAFIAYFSAQDFVIKVS